MSLLENLERQLALEQAARRQVEALLEEKSRQLNQAHEQLRLLVGQIDKLQQSEKQYRHIVESVQDIIFKTSIDGFFTFVNSVVEQSLGYTREEIIGLNFINLIVPEWRATLVGFYQTMIQAKESSTYIEFPVKAKDGRTVWIGQTVRLIDGDETGPELVAIARDITQRVIDQDAFRTIQARMESLISNLQTAILVEDENRKVILANQLYCDLFEIPYSSDELIGLDYRQLTWPPKELFANPEQFINEMADERRQRYSVASEVVKLVDGRTLERTSIPIFQEG